MFSWQKVSGITSLILFKSSSGVCDKRPVVGKKGEYERRLGSSWLKEKCPTGWIYQIELCECTRITDLEPATYSFEGHSKFLRDAGKITVFWFILWNHTLYDRFANLVNISMNLITTESCYVLLTNNKMNIPLCHTKRIKINIE